MHQQFRLEIDQHFQGIIDTVNINHSKDSHQNEKTTQEKKNSQDNENFSNDDNLQENNNFQNNDNSQTNDNFEKNDNFKKYVEKQNDSLQEQIAVAFLGCVFIDIKVLNPTWGIGEHANRPLQMANVTRLKKALLVCCAGFCGKLHRSFQQ